MSSEYINLTGKTTFSLVIPTRDRKKFIETGLNFLDSQDYDGDFEIIIVDNPSEDSQNCELICNKKRNFKLKYIRCDKPIDMVSNWNKGLTYAENEYVGYLTDKMFLLPGILKKVDKLIKLTHPDIVTWLENSYSPLEYPDYFGSGYYIDNSKRSFRKKYSIYSGKTHLNKMMSAKKAREYQNQSEYNRGKICFGLFSRQLISQILSIHGKLFYPISPDYTSRVLGCIYSKKSIQINHPGIVHIGTDLSNGGWVSRDDQSALAFIQSLDISNFFIPDLYTSINNLILTDYMNMVELADSEYNLNLFNWVKNIFKDIHSLDRKWSSKKIEIEQKNILYKFLQANFSYLEIKKIKKFTSIIDRLNFLSTSKLRLLFKIIAESVKFRSISKVKLALMGCFNRNKLQSLLDVI